MPRIPSIKPRKERGRWILDFRFQGRRYRETVGPAIAAIRRLAQERATELMYAMAKGEFRPRTEEAPATFREFSEEYMAVHGVKLKWAPRVRGVLKHLLPCFGSRRLADITTLDVERYQTRRSRVVAPATVNRELAVLKNMFNKATAWGRFSGRNPVCAVKFLKENNARVRYLEPGEAERLLAACPPHLRPVVILARNAGMRQGEIAATTWADVDLHQGFIHVREAKSGEGRNVALNETAKAMLRSLPRGIRTSQVFLKPTGEPISEDWCYRQFQNACRIAGIEDFRFHDLRHDCASRLAMKGMSPEQIRRVLGHKTLVMTQRYMHLSSDHLLNVVRVLDEEVVTETDTPSVEDGRE